MKQQVSVFSVALLATAVILFACEGPAGPPGVQGVQGEKGERGEQGDPGGDGISIVWLGEIDVPPSQPGVNWAYYNTAEKKAYIWDGVSWRLLARDGELGGSGPKGDPGGDGLPIVWLGEFESAPAGAVKNQAYFNIHTGSSYIFNGEEWELLAKKGEDGPKGQQGEAGEKGEKGDSLYLVIFDANGGCFADTGNEIRNAGTGENSPIDPPEDPVWAWGDFAGWYTRQTGGGRYDFTVPVNAPLTLYARWIFNRSVCGEWLKNQDGGESADDPLRLSVRMNLDSMEDDAGNWQQLLAAVGEAGKFVEIDLSRCGMAGTVFNPSGSGVGGKALIVAITLPDTVTSISQAANPETGAFAHFTNLVSVGAKNLSVIGDYAFYGCVNLAAEVLPVAVVSVGAYAFSGCEKLSPAALPSSLVFIGEYAFSGCTGLALTELPPGVIAIGSYAFNECTNLKLTKLPDGITAVEKNTFYKCASLALEELPAGIKTIGANAFDGCTNLRLTALPEGLTSIGSYTFRGCQNLRLEALPEGIVSINTNTFNGCINLALTELPPGIKTIGTNAFDNCTNLALTELPEGLTTISGYAFRNCKNLILESLPEGITSISTNTFNGCINLALTKLPPGIKTIGINAFDGCTNLRLTELPEGLTTISNYTFRGCQNLGLESLPPGVTSIGENAFRDCTGLTEMTVYSEVKSIGNRAFNGCTGLKRFVCLRENTVTELGDITVFGGTHPDLAIMVPAVALEAYRSAKNWSALAARIIAVE